MEVKTHKLANSSLLGKPVEVVDGEAIVELRATDDMAVDEKGLIHGGFTFGLADYAAMLAVNHPNVVLGASDVRFLSPVQWHVSLLIGMSLSAKVQVFSNVIFKLVLVNAKLIYKLLTIKLESGEKYLT